MEKYTDVWRYDRRPEFMPRGKQLVSALVDASMPPRDYKRWRLVGRGRALLGERRYVLRTLPSGINARISFDRAAVRRSPEA